jgi:hypothetical protein
MKGVVGATLQQVVTHQVTKKEEEEEEEEGALTLPGRVYYIKPRKLHGGATIKEVRMHACYCCFLFFPSSLCIHTS